MMQIPLRSIKTPDVMTTHLFSLTESSLVKDTREFSIGEY
jgi:hypothetical protein